VSGETTHRFNLELLVHLITLPPHRASSDRKFHQLDRVITQLSQAALVASTVGSATRRTSAAAVL